QPANADASANPQGMPADHPPVDSTNNQGLPAGHPAIGNDAMPGLPANHPPVGNAGGAPMPGADQSNMANTAVPTAGGSGLRWTAPATWTPKAGSAMRKGSYAVKADGGEADLSITAFPGATGGLEANLARWRGQVGLPAVSSTEIVAATEKFDSNGLSFIVVDYANNGTRLVGAIVPYQGNSWFFKLMGPDAVVAGQKAVFMEFLHTVKAPEL
ncbi:MAG TPA: hypothetical protein VFJ90_14445, partial [Candidatus Didemnitutus sp.]|nr:hypothetical protein [Candidatus Didemnitutus sp.]